MSLHVIKLNNLLIGFLIVNSTYAWCTVTTFDLYFENDSSIKCHFHEGKSMSLLVDLENWSLMLNFFTLKIITAKDQFSSVALSCPTLCDPMDCGMPGFLVHHQLPEFTQTHAHWVVDAIHLILCCTLLLPPSIIPSIRVFSSESVLRMRWPKFWSFSFNINPFNEYSGLISFRMDWLDLLAVQMTLKRLLQHHSSKASILWCSAFFIV